MDHKEYIKPGLVVGVLLILCYGIFNHEYEALKDARRKLTASQNSENDASRVFAANQKDLSDWNENQAPMQSFLKAWDSAGHLQAIEPDELISRLSSLAVAGKLVATDPGLRRVDSYTFQGTQFPVTSVSMKFTGTLARELTFLGNLQFEYPHCRVEDISIAPSSDANVSMTVVVTIPKSLAKKEAKN